jgi:outer membrane protein TolC
LNRKEQVRNLYTNYLRRVDLTRYFESRSVDRANVLQVEDARSAELSARISYVTAVAGYLDLLDAFKLRLGLPVSEQIFLDDRELAAAEVAGSLRTDIRMDEAYKLAVERHVDILNAIDRFEDSKRKIHVAADQLRAELNIVGNATVSSESDPPDYTQFDPDTFRHSVGLELNLPLDRLRERNDYRATLVSFESQLRALALTLDRAKQRIDGGLRGLEEARLNILSQETQLAGEVRRVEASTIQLQAGRTEVRDLREAQDALISAQIALTTRRVEYLRARLQLLLDLGVLETGVDKFWLRDPLATMLTEAQRGRSPLEMPRDTLIPPDQFLDPIP